MKYRSIVVPLDGSAHAAAALDLAIVIAKGSEAWLTLLHVVEPPNVPPVGGVYVAGLLAEESEEQATELLDRAVARVPEGVRVCTVVRHGHAADEIVRRIAAAEHDLVVIGSRGRGALRSLLLGSVSRDVLHRSPVPVIVVHADREASAEVRLRTIA